MSDASLNCCCTLLLTTVQLLNFQLSDGNIIRRPRSLRRGSRRVLLLGGPRALAPWIPRVDGARASSGSQSCQGPVDPPFSPPPGKSKWPHTSYENASPGGGSGWLPRIPPNSSPGAAPGAPPTALRLSPGCPPGAPPGGPQTAPGRPPTVLQDSLTTPPTIPKLSHLPPPDSLHFIPNVVPTPVQCFEFLGNQFWIF